MASFGDCPLVQGRLYKLDAATGGVQATFDAVPAGCTGGGIWTSPTIDEAAGTVFVSTGNGGSCGVSEPYAVALVKLRAGDLGVVSSYRLPAAETIADGDFGATPTLFSATLNGTLKPLVGAINKNGRFYAFDRDNIHTGPLWKTQLTTHRGSIAPAAFDGATLYVGTTQATINGASCSGSVQALNPATGAIRWRHCFHAGGVIGAVTATTGILLVNQGKDFNIITSATGASLYHFSDPNGKSFVGPATVLNGIIYDGNRDGNLFTFAA
jgi:polyvinyl alcohol dehydrogenase (cytochrome)